MSNSFSLSGKRILFIGIGFYDYDKAICTKLEELGGVVTYICSVEYNTYYRLLKLFGLRKSARKYAELKRRQLICNTSTDNDYIFIIKGECLTQDDINLINSMNPKAKSIIYFWDDLNRIENSEIILKNYSNIWSFDPDDCQKFGFKYRPLFYRDNIVVNQNKKYYISSIGWCHSNRLEVFRKIAKQLKKENKSYFLKLFVGWKSYYINRYFNRNFQSTDKELIITSPLKYSDVMRVISDSHCILDIPHPSQKGLSIRTIEALKARCHIFTTNKYISNISSIPSNCYTLISDDFVIDTSERGYQSSLSTYYSLRSFLEDLFS